tara:strand:- start:373 stop:561 length:189 start_codon:yes stop_codon:yes gene_type:complete
MGVVLNAGGAWYLGVKDEDAGAAAASCYIAAVVYGIYVALCGCRIVKANARGKNQLHDDEDV